MTTARGRVPLARKVWGAATAALAVGALLYLTLAYRVLQAGGLTPTSLRSTCAEAATGVASASYRVSEDVTIERTFLPLSATCHWTGGSSVGLVDLGGLSFVGPVLALAGIVVLVGVQISGRSR